MNMSRQELKANYGPIDTPLPREFETPRLMLRALTVDDGKLIYDLYASDPVATKYMSFKRAEKIEDTEAFVKSVTDYFAGKPSFLNHLVWIVALKETGQPIGTVGIGPNGINTLSGGYILNSRYWGHGYASEAWGCIVEWAKSHPRVMRIEAHYDLDNPNSGKVLEKCGLKYEGILKNHALHPNVSDKLRDVIIHAWVRDAKS